MSEWSKEIVPVRIGDRIKIRTLFRLKAFKNLTEEAKTRWVNACKITFDSKYAEKGMLDWVDFRFKKAMYFERRRRQLAIYSIKHFGRDINRP